MSRSFLRATSLVGILTLLSRITGLMRDMVYARMFPTGTGLMDAWLIAFQIPNFLRRLFAEGAFSQAFVPVVAEYRVRRSTEEVRGLIDGVTGTLGAFLLVVSLIGVVVAPILVLIFAPGFRQDGTRYDLAVEMLRWTFPYLLFVSLTALGGGVLNSYGRFALPAFSSVLLNLVMIVAAAWVSPHVARPGLALAVGLFVAGILQVAIMLPPLLRLGLIRRPRWHWQHEGVRRIGKLMVPAIIGSSMGQLSVVVSSSIASLLFTGSIAWLYYADRLVEFPLGVFSIALATVILPSLSAHHAEESPERFSDTLEWALRLLCLIVIPASLALFVLAGPLTVAIFHYGHFSTLDVRMTAAALMAYSFALFGWSLVKVLAPGYFARQDTRTPVRTAMQSLGLTMGLNVVFVVSLALMGLLKEQGMHILLAVSNGIGALFNAWMLFHGLRRDQVLRLTSGWPALLLRMAAANAAMAAFLYYFAGSVDEWLSLHTRGRVLWLTTLVCGGLAIYFASLWLLGARPGHFRHRVPQK